ncbi:MAG: hypothetical protein QM704_26310 [Anaeromyxobacteraceae bacterium]
MPPKAPPLFIRIPPEERVRLEELTRGIETLDGAVARLGEPDTRARLGGHAELCYGRLSEVAEIRVSGFGGQGVLVSIVPRAARR